MFCSNCQFLVQGKDNFCVQCGARVSTDKTIADVPAEIPASVYEGEKLLKVFRQKSGGKIFDDDVQIEFLKGDVIDIFFLNKRICLTSPNEDAKKPKRIGILLPLGGAIGFGLNAIAVGTVNFARDRLFESKVGGTPTAIQFDSMCAEDSCIFSFGSVTAIINKNKKKSFFEFVIAEEKTTEIAFISKYQTSKGLISGGFILTMIGEKSDFEYTFGKMENISFVQTDKPLEYLDFWLYCRKYNVK